MSNDAPQNVSKNPIQTTFADTGLRAKKSLAEHLVERTISSPTYPWSTAWKPRAYPSSPLVELPVFVDDMHVFGYLRSEDTVQVRGSISCTAGDSRSAQNVVGKIRTALRDTLGTKRHIEVHILHTILLEKEAGSTIRSTLAKIEKDTNAVARTTWKKTVWRHRTVRGGRGKDRRLRYIDGQTPTALSQIERNLLAFGYVIYSIDYTQDFSGVLDRKALGQYLCNVHEFRERDKLYSAMKDGTPTILANTRTVGNTYARGYTTRPTDIRSRRRCTTRSFPNSKRERSKQSLVAGCESTWTVLVPIYAKHFSTPTYNNEDVLVARSLSMRVEAASCLVQRPKRS